MKAFVLVCALFALNVNAGETIRLNAQMRVLECISSAEQQNCDYLSDAQSETRVDIVMEETETGTAGEVVVISKGPGPKFSGRIRIELQGPYYYVSLAVMIPSGVVTNEESFYVVDPSDIPTSYSYMTVLGEGAWTGQSRSLSPSLSIRN